MTKRMKWTIGLIIVLLVTLIIGITGYYLFPIYSVSLQSIESRKYTSWELVNDSQKSNSEINYDSQYRPDVIPIYNLRQKPISTAYTEKMVFKHEGYIRFLDTKGNIDSITINSLTLKADDNPAQTITEPMTLTLDPTYKAYTPERNINDFEQSFSVQFIPKKILFIEAKGVMVTNEDKKIPFIYTNEGKVKTTIHRSSRLDKMREPKSKYAKYFEFTEADFSK